MTTGPGRASVLNRSDILGWGMIDELVVLGRLGKLIAICLFTFLFGCSGPVALSTGKNGSHDVRANSIPTGLLSVIKQVIEHNDLHDIKFDLDVFEQEIATSSKESYKFLNNTNEVIRITRRLILKKRADSRFFWLNAEMHLVLLNYSDGDFPRGYLSGKILSDSYCVHLSDFYDFFDKKVGVFYSTGVPSKPSYIVQNKRENWITLTATFDEKNCLRTFSLSQNYER